MAFNFNWSPLIADTILARDLLTSALNKTPKPPIIVDDIIVTELNLGATPPDLTLLEVGDLAQDRFRGVFKVTYDGDAFLTLRTKVQANPLNTELRKRRREGSGAGAGWCEPGCLAADTGLTIPLQITLSDFRLSGFVILVFSRQKGLTLVFRNDPLESLKVSSTFDAIPFVRDYLQRTIEERLRTLFMEDLPAILHRLSLRLWGDEYSELDDRLRSLSTAGTALPDQESSAIDPLASPPQDPLSQAAAQALEEGTVPPFILDSNAEIHATFSQKNLLQLGALSEAQRTLNLSTPSIRDAVFRAWASITDRGSSSGTGTPLPNSHTLSSSRLHSHLGRSSTSLCSGDSGDVASESFSAISERPSIARSTSSSYIAHSERRSNGHHHQRKKKHRVINLRRTATNNAEPTDDLTTPTASNSAESSAYAASAPSVIAAPIEEGRNADRASHKVHFLAADQGSPLNDATPRVLRKPSQSERTDSNIYEAPPAYSAAAQSASSGRERTERVLSDTAEGTSRRCSSRPRLPDRATKSAYPNAISPSPYASAIPLFRTLSADKVPLLGNETSPLGGLSPVASSGGILEQAWLQKMAREVAAKVEEERILRRGNEHRASRPSLSPPAYGE